MSRFDALGTVEENPQIPLYPTVVGHVSRKRQLRLVVLGNHKEATTPRDIVLASPDLSLEGRKRVELYSARVQSEFLFRASKHFTGRTDCQSRAEPVLDFHFTAALAPLNLARAEEVRAQTDPSPPVFSMASWPQRHCNARLLDLFIERVALDSTWIKNHPDYEELRTFGAIAA